MIIYCMGLLDKFRKDTPTAVSEESEKNKASLVSKTVTYNKYGAINRPKEFDYSFKLILIGDGGVGKTTLFRRSITNRFEDSTQMTIGVDPQSKYFDVEYTDGKKYKVALQLWDIGGQERFEFMRKSFYRGAMGALLVYDVTRYESFNNLDKWVTEFCDVVGYDVPIVILGNKVDCPVDERSVKIEYAEESTRDRFMHLETSAKTGENVERAFAEITRRMINYSVNSKKK
jgi:small GTP-binding protein